MEAYGKVEGQDIWKQFRPSYIRAFNDAKDIATNKKIGKTISADDYVQPSEFRCLAIYLCVYCVMFDAFSLIDGDSAGTTADDDRRIDIDEWKAGYSKIAGIGFAAFQASPGIDDATLEGIFQEMDDDSKGKVLLNEFCAYIEQKEQDAGTAIGSLLAAGDDGHGQPQRKGPKGKPPTKHVAQARSPAPAPAPVMYSADPPAAPTSSVITVSDYGSEGYWNERYTKHFEVDGDAAFDWYQDYRSLRPHLIPHCNTDPDFEILIPGCGNSEIGAHLYDEGFLNITNIDISSVAVSFMAERYGDREEMEFTHMDATNMLHLPDGCFNLVVDKVSCGVLQA
jgi:hypothetical protein